jgi:hypothetical protein
LILHLNTKYCHASPDKANRILVVSIGKKCCQELDDAYSVEFAYRVAATTPEYFDVGLNAKTGRLAMKTCLATLESGKVGFTSTGKQSSGQPDYIGGVRGVVERNLMRYCLAIDAYLGTLAGPPCGTVRKAPAELVCCHRALSQAVARS